MSQLYYRYPGLKPFEVNEAALFFGRTQETKDLFNLVLVERLIVLFAKSGMGKTSLINAGLIPLLDKTDLLPVYVRFNDTVCTLHEQFFSKMKSAGVQFNPVYADKTIWEQLKYAQTFKNGKSATPLLIFDQFEEIFTLHTPEQRQLFIRDFADVANQKVPETLQAALLRLVQENPEISDATLAEMERQPSVRCVFSLRSDLLHLLNGLSVQIPNILRSRYELLAFSEKGATEAIVLPAQLAGRPQASPSDDAAFASPPFRYHEAALSEIRSQLSKQGKASIESFQLQIICQAIEKLVIQQVSDSTPPIENPTPVVSPALYGGAPGIQRLLTDFYADKISELPEVQQLPARHIIEEELITESERRRSVDESDLLKRSVGASPQLLHQLVEMRLLRKEPRLDSFYYEISHDTLVPPILIKYKERRREEERIVAIQRQREEQAKRDEMLAIERRKRIRSRRFTFFALVLSAISVTAMIFAIWQRNKAERDKRRAYSNDIAYKSQIALRDGDRTMAFQLAAYAQRYVEDNNPQVFNALIEAFYYNDHPDTALIKLPWNYDLEGHEAAIRSVAFSPPYPDDPKGGKKLATGSDDHTIKIWNTETNEVLMTLNGHSDNVNAIAFSPDGRRLASVSDDNSTKIWDLGTGQEVDTLMGHAESVICVAFSPDGKKLATGSNDNTIRIQTLETGKYMILRGSEYIRAIAFSPDGTMIAAGANDNTTKIWNVATQKLEMTLQGHRDDVRSIAFSPDGKTLLTGSDDRTARIWNLKTQKTITILEGHSNFVSSVAFSPDGQKIATGSEDNTIKIWDVPTERVLLKLVGHHGAICSVAFSPDGKKLATGAFDHFTKIWDLDIQDAAIELKGHRDGILSIAISPDGKKCATGSFDSIVNIWDTENGSLLLRLKGHQDTILSVAFSPDSKKIASASEDQTTKIWDVATGNILLTLQGHTDFVNSVVFAPDGKRLATGSADKTAKIWDAGSGQVLNTLKQREIVRCVAFSKDGTKLATGSNGRIANIWDLNTQKVVMALKGHTNWITDITFSQDGQTLATGSFDNTAKIWDIKKGAEIITLGKSDEDMRLNGIAFSPDAKRLATGYDDWKVKIWEIASGKVAITLHGHQGTVNSVAFSYDGTLLATGSDDATGKIWDLDANHIISRLFNKRKLANFTDTQLEEWGLNKISR